MAGAINSGYCKGSRVPVGSLTVLYFVGCLRPEYKQQIKIVSKFSELGSVLGKF